MLTLKDIVTDEKELGTWYPRLSLSKIAGQKIVDVEVQYNDEYNPALRVIAIRFENGKSCGLDDHEPFIEDYSGQIDDSEPTLLDLKRQIDEAYNERHPNRS